MQKFYRDRKKLLITLVEKYKSTIECKKQMLNQLKKNSKLERNCAKNLILPPLMQKEKLSSYKALGKI